MIVVIVTAPLAQLLQQETDARNTTSETEYRPVLQWLKDQQGTLLPTFPGSTDGSLQLYFELRINKKMDEKELSEFRQFPGIDGAYEKGEESLPA